MKRGEGGGGVAEATGTSLGLWNYYSILWLLKYVIG